MTLTVDVSTMLSIGESSSTMPMSALSRFSSNSFSSSDDDTDAASSESKRSSGGQLSSPGKKVDDNIAMDVSTVDALVLSVSVGVGVDVVKVEMSLLITFVNGSVVATLAAVIDGFFTAVDDATLAMATTFIVFGSVAVVFADAAVVVVVKGWRACSTGSGCWGNVIGLKPKI